MKAVRQLSPIHRMAPWLRTYGSYQGRECSTRPCHGSGYAHSALEHSQLTYGYAIGMSGMQLLRCWYCAIPGPVRPPLVSRRQLSFCESIGNGNPTVFGRTAWFLAFFSVISSTITTLQQGQVSLIVVNVIVVLKALFTPFHL